MIKASAGKSANSDIMWKQTFIIREIKYAEPEYFFLPVPFDNDHKAL
jgi:hypothetical protein